MNNEMVEKNDITNKGANNMKKMKHILKNQKGLTLIELLAVIVILAIVAAIAVPSIGNIIENSRVGAIKADAQNAMAGAQLYFTENADENSVTVEDLVSKGFLEEKGSLNASGTTIAKPTGATNTGNTITGSGTNAGITVTFTSATNAAISEHKNSERPTSGAIVVSK